MASSKSTSAKVCRLVSFMRKMIKDERAQVDCCHKLTEVCNQGEAHAGAVAKAGGGEAVVAAMRIHPRSVSVQLQGCMALANIAVYTDFRHLVVKAGAIEVVVAAMRAHPTSFQVQHRGCGALGNMALHAEVNIAATAELQFLVSEAGGIEVVLAAMRNHPHSDAVQEFGCFALANLTILPSNKPLAVKAGGFEAVMHAMRTYPSQADVQEYGCRALHNLMEGVWAGYKGGGAAQSKLGGARVEQVLHAIVKAMSVHTGCALVQRYACTALLSILGTFGDVDERVDSLLAAAGGVQAIVQAMRTNKVESKGDGEIEGLASQKSTVRPGAQNSIPVFERRAQKIAADVVLEDATTVRDTCINLHRLGCTLLADMAMRAEFKSLVVEQGGIEAVVHSMQSLVIYAGVQEEGCRALMNIAECVAHEQHVAEAGGAVAVLNGMRTHPKEEEVQHFGCRALVNIAGNARNQHLVAASGGIELVIGAMREHPASLSIQRWGCSALLNLAVSSCIRPLLVQAGAIEAIVSAMQAHVQSAEVQYQGCGALLNMSLSPTSGTRERMREQRVLSLVCQALASHVDYEELGRVSAELLETL